MKPRKNTILVMLLGLLLLAFASGIAQTTPQGDQKKAEVCCSMDTCCCNGGSCPMKHEGTANAEAKHDCSCCTGDSCEMKKSDAAKNHADHKGCCCCGESCDMSKHDGNTTKHDATMMKHDGKSHDGKACCKMKNKETKSKAAKKAA